MYVCSNVGPGFATTSKAQLMPFRSILRWHHVDSGNWSISPERRVLWRSMSSLLLCWDLLYVCLFKCWSRFRNNVEGPVDALSVHSALAPRRQRQLVNTAWVHIVVAKYVVVVALLGSFVCMFVQMLVPVSQQRRRPS